MPKEYIDREYYCKNICRCLGTECDKTKCPIWIATAADVVPVVHGEWINIPAYIGADGKLHKAQECPVCKAFFVSDPNKPYSNHPYCAECGAKMDGGGHGD